MKGTQSSASYPPITLNCNQKKQLPGRFVWGVQPENKGEKVLQTHPGDIKAFDLVVVVSHAHPSSLMKGVSLPETNIAPENRPLKKEILIGNHHFRVLCQFQGGFLFFKLESLGSWHFENDHLASRRAKSQKHPKSCSDFSNINQVMLYKRETLSTVDEKWCQFHIAQIYEIRFHTVDGSEILHHLGCIKPW